MKVKQPKVYTYTRVSTAMQIDGYSLEAQKARMKAFPTSTAMKLLASTRMQENPVSPLIDAFSSIK